MPGRDAAGGRLVAVRILGIDPAFDRVAAHLDAALRKRQFLASCHADLHLHDVDAGDQLGDRVLNLHARVHLNEEELGVLVQELEGADAAIADLLQAAARRSPIRSMTRRGIRRGGFLDDLWWRRCIEQSRSPSQTTFLCRRRTESRCGAEFEKLLKYTAGLPNAAWPRRGWSAPREKGGFGVDDAHAAPPPPPDALMTG
jgi:hypothetical protein